MIKFISIIVSCLVLFQSLSLDISDFGRIPTLFEHLSCHLEEGDSLGDFITLHYGSESVPHEKEHKEHNQLPFKHQHLDTHFQLIYVVALAPSLNEKIEIVSRKNNFLYKEPSTSFYTKSLFEPPQLT